MASPNPMFDMINASEYTFDDITRISKEKLPEIVPVDQSGKVIIVTGANVGIGFEAAKAIASMKPKLLILACRNIEKAEEAATSIKTSTGFQDITVEALDLASYASVQDFAKRFLAKGLPLDTLVSNAGLASASDWVLSKDGHEVTTQVNHIANVLLVLLLTPAIRKAAHPRIVVVASDVHFWARRPAQDDPTPVQTLLTKPDNVFFAQYPSSKLMNVLFAQEYARRAPFPVNICACNPGYTESQLGAKDADGGNVKEQHGMPGMPAKRSTYEGAKTIISCSISAEPPRNGGYYSEVRESRTRSSVQGEEGKKFGERVWKDTLDILKKTGKVESFEDWVEK